MATPDYSKLYQDALRNTQQAAQREQEYRRQDLLTPARTQAQEGSATSARSGADTLAKPLRGH